MSKSIIMQEDRAKASEVLQKFVNREIGFWKFQDDWPDSIDRVVRDIEERIDLRFSDHKDVLFDFNKDEELKKIIEYALIFLKSDEEYKWPEYQFFLTGWKYIKSLFKSDEEKLRKWEGYKKAGDFRYWPFIDQSQMDRAKQVLSNSSIK